MISYLFFLVIFFCSRSRTANLKFEMEKKKKGLGKSEEIELIRKMNMIEASMLEEECSFSYNLALFIL